MAIYTKTGDKGTTALASGERVAKTDARIEAYGTVDELNSWLGLLDVSLPAEHREDIHAQILWIQNKLFNLGALLAAADGEWITEADVRRLEERIDEMQAGQEPLRAFVLPGGNEAVSLCHVCRTITRRLERQMVSARESGIETDETVMQFVNRLSDFWFVLALKQAENDKITFFFWKK
jgi:cob(I)alamin adenosyltransferase